MRLQLLVVSPRRKGGLALMQRVNAAEAGQICAALTPLTGLEDTIAQRTPQVVLLEYRFGDRVFARALNHVARTLAGSRVPLLLATDLATDEMLAQVLRHGVVGCFSERLEPQMLAKAIRCVAEGQDWFPREALMRALAASQGQCDSTGPGEITEASSLTPREHEVLALAGIGLKNKEIGKQLRISDKTVSTLLHRSYVKLNARGRLKAVAVLRASRPATGSGAFRREEWDRGRYQH
jgi:DNA-binding NarL/FixJ family response regulator